MYVSGRATTQLLELVIPHEVVYSNITYKVEGIGASIFNGSPANLRHIVLSEGIEYIGNDSFKNNKQLISITLPSTLTSIGNNVFSGSSGLLLVYAYYYDPPVISSTVFSGSTSKAVLHVPKGAAPNYASKVGWNSFTIVDDLIPFISDLGSPVEVEKPVFDMNLMSGQYVVGTVNEVTSIPVNLHNTENIFSCQFGIKLHENIEIVDGIDGFVEVTERGENATVSQQQSGDGTISVTCNFNTPLEAGEGPVLNLKVKTAWQNTYTIPVTNMTVTTADGTVKQLPDCETRLIMQGVRGDMNGDGRVDLSDALYIINLATGLAE